MLNSSVPLRIQVWFLDMMHSFSSKKIPCFCIPHYKLESSKTLNYSVQCWWKLFKWNCTKHCNYNEELEIIHKSEKTQQANVPYCFIPSFLFLNFALEIKLRLFPNGKTQRLYAQGTLLDCAGVSFCGSIYHAEFLYHLFMIITFLKVQKKRKLKQDFQCVCVLFEVMTQYTHSHFQRSVISVDAYLN